MILVDTHVVLWVLTGDDRLSARGRQALRDAPERLVSAASVWEMAIKCSLGKLTVPDKLLDHLDAAGFTRLEVSADHAWATQSVVGLPHRDPFDRLLIAQASVERVPLMTADSALLGADLEPAITLIDAR